MSAKRKTSQPNPTNGKAGGGKKTATRSKSASASHESPQDSQKKTHSNEVMSNDDRMLAFSKSLHKMPATLKPSPKFERQWEDLLAWHEEKEREWLAGNTGNQNTGTRLIQRRWAVLDRARNAYDYLEKKPSADLHPIPIIVVNWHGTWDLPPSLRDTVIQHPIYRALKSELPQSTPKNDLIQLMRWAMSLSSRSKDEEPLLSSIAHECDALIHDVDMFDSPDDEWLRLARQNDDFWSLLQKMFDFGRRHAIWQTYRDGAIEGLTRKALLKQGGRYASKMRHHVERLMNDYQREIGSYPTAMKLLDWLDGKRPDDSDGSPLIFTGENGQSLVGMDWTTFNETVKSAKKKRK